MKPKALFLLLCSLLVLFSCGKKDEAAEAPPLDIPVIVTKAEEVPIFQNFVGQVFGLKDIAIRARVEGFLEEMNFQEGSLVKEGDLLYTLESQPFEADVAAKMSQVAEAKTMLAKARSDLNRIRPLAKNKAVSESDLDSAVAQHEAYQSAVEAAKANLRASKIQLGYTRVHSPINGLIGKTKAKVGDFVGRSPNPVILNVVSDIDTVLVQFFLTETQYLKFARRYLEKQESKGVGIKNGQDEERESNIELILADGTIYPHKGKYDFIDREVDPTTGAILIQTSFPNPDKFIRPGQFARVRVKVAEVKDGILIPQRCVREIQSLYSVFVVDENGTVQEREVQVGPTIKNQWLILEGLKPGEKVVYEGLQKIADGATVNPVVQDVKPAEMEKQ
jgi:membrane fusion protein (multidrug efflux system)